MPNHVTNTVEIQASTVSGCQVGGPDVIRIIKVINHSSHIRIAPYYCCVDVVIFRKILSQVVC